MAYLESDPYFVNCAKFECEKFSIWQQNIRGEASFQERGGWGWGEQAGPAKLQVTGCNHSDSIGCKNERIAFDEVFIV